MNRKQATAPATYLKDHTDRGRSVDYYGLRCRIVNHPNCMKVPLMNGLFGQYVPVIPEKDAVIVRLGNAIIEWFIDHDHPENFYYIDAGLSVLA